MKPTLYRQHDFYQPALIEHTGSVDSHRRTIANAPLRAYVVTSEEVSGVDNATRLIAGVCSGYYADGQFYR